MTDTPTPITDAAKFEVRGATPIPDIVVYASFAENLERKLDIAREALKEILFICREPKPLVDLDEARKIAKEALTDSTP